MDAVSVIAPKGFMASGVAAGIKPGAALDLAVVAAHTVVPAAAVEMDDLPADGQAQSRPLTHHLCGEERVENLRNKRVVHSDTGIHHAHLHVLPDGEPRMLLK